MHDAVVKNLPANLGGLMRQWFDPWVGGISREGHGNLLEYSCLENSMDRGAWWATVHGVANSQT